ncbi:hypothetical protein Lal_00000693 [Lupinus albus]|nr:hypothetical protein Lal_00000693 [Lupinus albus]
MRNVVRKKGESSKRRKLKPKGSKKWGLDMIGKTYIDVKTKRIMIPVEDGDLYVDLTIPNEDMNVNDDSDMDLVRDSGKDIENQSGSSAGQGNPNPTPPSRVPSDIRDQKKGEPRNKRQGTRLRRNSSNVEINVPNYGKHTVLCWMVDMGTIQPNDRVYYMGESNSVLLDGTITRGGIRCKCCHGIVSVSEFEAHSGSKNSDPYRNICLEGGTSLLHCMLEAWNKQDASKLKVSNFVSVADEDFNDSACIVCGDYGNLLCCDSCPSTFHQSCLGMDVNHNSCVEADGGMILESGDAFFCGNKCQEAFGKLERLIGVKHEIGGGYSWTLIRRSNVDFGDLHMKSHMVECNSKLALALSLMDECFLPCMDGRTNINVLNSVLYNCWSNFNRVNFEKFVTAILEKDDKVICAASIRIDGNQIAEMPYIATSYMYRRQGMCRRLMNAIESALKHLDVELLVIPAISKVKKTWISSFGFEPITLKTQHLIRDIKLLVFPGVEKLQKRI